jgi:hypothetical protein
MTTEVIINEVISSVRAVDSDTLLATETLNRILKAVMMAVEEKQTHDQRVAAEQRITRGVADEIEEGW